MTDDEKKALIVAGGIAVIGLAIWLTRQNANAAIIPGNAVGVQPGISLPPGPGYTTYNVPPYGATPTSNIYPPLPFSNDNGSTAGGCCGCGGGNSSDGCFTSGGINTGNAPTSINQLLNWYSVKNPGLAGAMNNSMQAFNVPPSTIMEQTTPVGQVSSSVY